MGKLLNQLQQYFENTPKEVLDKELKEWEYLNEIGPDVLEYAKLVRGYINQEEDKSHE
jgi:tyrosine type site-specific recombinase